MTQRHAIDRRKFAAAGKEYATSGSDESEIQKTVHFNTRIVLIKGYLRNHLLLIEICQNGKDLKC